MELHNIKPDFSRKKSIIVGRGNGSKRGNYSRRGLKGQSSRSGGKRKPGFEGGQTPLLRKMPKLKGFKSINKKNYKILNLEDLNIFNDGDEITMEKLLEKRLINKADKNLKILGNGDIKKKLTFKINNISNSAKLKIEKAEGVLN